MIDAAHTDEPIDPPERQSAENHNDDRHVGASATFHTKWQGNNVLITRERHLSMRRSRLVKNVQYGNRAAQSLTSQTSTHSAEVSCARRSGAILTALWVDPAAGTTMSNVFIEMSQ